MAAADELKRLYQPSSMGAEIAACAETFEKEEIRELVDIYRDNWLYIIKRELAKLFTADTFQDLQYLLTRENNLIKRVVNDLSVIYNKPPTRRAIIGEDGEGNTIEDEAYNDLHADSLKDLALKSVNRYTNLINHCLLMVTWRKNSLDYDVLTLDNATPYFDANDWREMIAVKYYIGMQYDSIHGQMISYDRAYIWVKKDLSNSNLDIIHNENVTVLQGGMIYEVQVLSGTKEHIVSTTPIPYQLDGEPVLPFVLFDKEYPVGQRFDFTSGNDLRDLGICTAVILTMINQLYLHQTFKQVVLTVPDLSKVPGKLKFGPGNVLAFEQGRDGQNATATSIDLQSNIEALQKTLEARIMSVLTGYGVSPQNFTMSAQPQSGYALTISNMGKMEAREAQLPLYRAHEKELFEIERVIYNANAPAAGLPIIDVKAKFEIDFAEITYPQSYTEQAQRYNMMKTYNVLTDIDILMEQNPDITRERAEEMYAENKSRNDSQKMALPPLTGVPPVR